MRVAKYINLENVLVILSTTKNDLSNRPRTLCSNNDLLQPEIIFLFAESCGKFVYLHKIWHTFEIS